jgi:selenocysteine-specific elongation factor
LIAPNGGKLHAGVVDVPGHEDFVRNMIAGIGSIDLALLVVAADDGWMPQTEEHLQILTYLGVRRAVVALTKSDIGHNRAVSEEIQNQLRDTVFASAPIVQTSVRTGEGLADLKSAIASELAGMQPQRDFGKPRLFIDRVFTLRGIGTVVTGTLTGGRFCRGQNIIVQPQKLQARIRSIQSHGVELDDAQPGMRTALNLPDLAIDQIKRGDVITNSDLPASTVFTAQIERSSRLSVKDAAGHRLRNGSSVYIHHGTSRVTAKVTSVETNSVEPGQKTIAQLKLASPIFAFVGDRFVVRDGSEQHTIAGGVVLCPDRVNHREPKQRKLFSLRAAAPHDVHVCVRSEIALRDVVSRTTLLDKSHFSAGEISEALTRLQRENEIVICEEIVADHEFWQGQRRQAIALIDDAHKRNPERVGLDFNELRAAFRDQPQNVFDALIAQLCTGDFMRKESAIARISHRPLLSAELQAAEKKVREALSRQPFDPPPRREIEPDEQAQHVLRFLVETGEVVQITPDVLLLRKNFERMKEMAAEFISKSGPATVSELRQALQSSRRIMVPLLERLDRDGVTRRVGDRRMLCTIRNV